ncbi:DNA-directed RNA polymerase, partial [Ganoderma leucocontextum]
RSVDFDLVGVDASIANTFRRILIAEVSTIAQEDVYIFDNTSVIHDGILSRRLGLTPLNIDPRLEFRSQGELHTGRNTLVFKYVPPSHHILLRPPTSPPPGSSVQKVPKDAPQIIHDVGTTGDLVWGPQGEQDTIFSANPSAATNHGHRHRKDGAGAEGLRKEHAKWSAVATTSYRLHPLVVLNPSKPVPREHAEKFAKCFSPGVVRVGAHGEVSIDEHNLRRETMSREVLRRKEFDGCVELKHIRDWFIFSVESEGAYTPESLLPEAMKVMRQDCVHSGGGGDAPRGL